MQPGARSRSSREALPGGSLRTRGAGLGDALGSSTEVRGGRRHRSPGAGGAGPGPPPSVRHPGTGLTSGGDGEISQEKPGAAAGARTAPAGPGTPPPPPPPPPRAPPGECPRARPRPTRVPAPVPPAGRVPRPAPLACAPRPARPTPRVPAPGPPNPRAPLASSGLSGRPRLRGAFGAARQSRPGPCEPRGELP